MGLGFTCALTLMGAFREILGSGKIFGFKLWNFSIDFFASSAGAFFTYALFIAAFAAISDKCDKTKKIAGYKTVINQAADDTDEAFGAFSVTDNASDNKTEDKAEEK